MEKLFEKRFSFVSIVIASLFFGLLAYQVQETKIAKLEANQRALSFEQAFARTQAVIDRVPWNSDLSQLADAFMAIGYKISVVKPPTDKK